MDIQKIENLAHEHMANRRTDPNREPGFILQHGYRTAQIALHLAEQVNAKIHKDILYAGGLLHDIGKGAEPHNETGALFVGEILKRICQGEELNQICAIVYCHNQRQQPNEYAPEIKLVQDADYLDHVGPMGSWLGIYRIGTRNETIMDALRFFHSEERAHFLALMRNGLNYDISVAIYDQRLDFEARFFQELEHVQQQGL
jgi:uncharacterized protein